MASAIDTVEVPSLQLLSSTALVSMAAFNGVHLNQDILPIPKTLLKQLQNVKNDEQYKYTVYLSDNYPMKEKDEIERYWNLYPHRFLDQYLFVEDGVYIYVDLETDEDKEPKVKLLARTIVLYSEHQLEMPELEAYVRQLCFSTEQKVIENVIIEHILQMDNLILSVKRLLANQNLLLKIVKSTLHEELESLKDDFFYNPFYFYEKIIRIRGCMIHALKAWPFVRNSYLLFTNSKVSSYTYILYITWIIIEIFKPCMTCYTLRKMHVNKIMYEMCNDLCFSLFSLNI